MKKNYLALLLVILFSGIAIAQEAQKKFINYQGLVRNADSSLMASEKMTIKIALKFGAANAASIYEESHIITTDANGVFSLLIGNGRTAKGDFNGLPWGSAATFVTVSMNGREIGTTEMMAVPYALSSGDADDQTAAEVGYDNTTSGLTATTAQEAIDEMVIGGSVDADADPTNELQTISFDAVSNKISLTDGGEITIPSGGTDADADPTNEIQDISLSGTELTITDGSTIDLAPIVPPGGTDDQNLVLTGDVLSIENGSGTVDLSAYAGNDADADPTNEIQDISLSGTELTITDGSTIDLAPIVPPGGTDDQNLVLTGDVLSIENGSGTVDLSAYAGNDADADPTNELQDITLSGTELTITDGSTIDLAPIVPPGGADDQNLVLTGDVLSIENGSGSVDLSTYASDDADADPTNEIDVTAESGILTGDGTIVSGLFGTADGQVAKWDDGTSKWVAGTDETGGSSLWAENGNNVHYSSGNVGIGTDTPTSKLDVDGDIRSSDLEGTGQRNVMADADGKLVIGGGGVNGASKIDDLSDGKSDANGSSLFLGLNAGANDDGSDNFNVGIGYRALQNNTTGLANTATGHYALGNNTVGALNTANGNYALLHNTTGSFNTANGARALYANTTGEYNTANGLNALHNNTTGSSNTANGYNVLYVNTTGSGNTGNGARALYNNTLGEYNTANGNGALHNNTTGSSNTANGSEALYYNYAGSYNSAYGSQALRSNRTGIRNVANGYRALYSNTSGEHNTANGYDAQYSNTTGGHNTVIGYSALYSNTIGGGNVAIGSAAGLHETGSNKLYIANNGTSTPLIYGEFDTKILTVNGATTVISSVSAKADLVLGGTSGSATGDDGIISSDPNYAGSDIFIRSNDAVVVQLDFDDNEAGDFEIMAGDGTRVFEVNESGNVRVNGAIVHASDKRLKKDIEDLPYGLNEILQLQPKAYNWKNNAQQSKSLGLIAQDVQPLIKEIVTAQDNDEKTLGISYTELIPILINAIQEQQAQIEVLKTNSKSQATALATILNRVNTLENARPTSKNEVIDLTAIDH